MDSLLRRFHGRSRFQRRIGQLASLAAIILVLPAMISAQGIRLSGRPMAGDVREFEIAPDGKHIVYVADQELAGDIELFSVALGGTPTTLYDFPEGGAYWFSICEERVLFMRWGDTLFSRPIDGGGPRQVLDLGLSDLASGVSFSHGPIYAPETGRIVYVRRRYDWDYVFNQVEEDLALFSVDIRRGERSLVRLDDLDGGPFEIEPFISDFVIVMDGQGVMLRTTRGSLFKTWIDRLSLLPLGISADSPLLLASNGARAVFVRRIAGAQGYALHSLTVNSSREVLLSSNVHASSSADFRFREALDRVIYRTDQEVDGRFELFSVRIDGSSPPIKLNQTLDPFERVESFQLSPEGKRVVYLADQDVDEVREIYGVPSDGSLPSVQLNDPLAPGGDVVGYAIGTQRIVYLADQEQDERFELYSAPPRRKLASGVIKVSGPLVPGGDVLSDFRLTPDGLRVVYRADQDADEVFELYVASLDGTSRPRKLNAQLVRGGDVQSGFRTGFQVTDDLVVYRADQDTDEVFELYASFLSAPAERLGDFTGPAPGIRSR